MSFVSHFLPIRVEESNQSQNGMDAETIRNCDIAQQNNKIVTAFNSYSVIFVTGNT